jgi:glycerate kinase
VYTDVENEFTGNKGATVVYGPQKGATPLIVE